MSEVRFGVSLSETVDLQMRLVVDIGHVQENSKMMSFDRLFPVLDSRRSWKVLDAVAYTTIVE